MRARRHDPLPRQPPPGGGGPRDHWGLRFLLGGLHQPGPERFGGRQLASWCFHVLLLGLTAACARAVRADGGITIVYAAAGLLLLLWAMAVWGRGIGAWLDGARRYPAFRWLLVLSSAAGGLGALWAAMVALYMLAGGLASLFARPGMELLSLANFLARFSLMAVGVAGLVVSAWFSLRVAWQLAWGGAVLPAQEDLPPPVAPQARGVDHDAVPTDARPAAPLPGRWHSRRPLALQPAVSPNGDTVLAAYRFIPLNAYHPSADARREPLARIDRCRQALDWPAFEWALRTEPSWQEVRDALLALPNLAAVADPVDALEIRAWLERFTRDPRSFELERSHRDDMAPAEAEVVRLADFARDALRLWDAERPR